MSNPWLNPRIGLRPSSVDSELKSTDNFKGNSSSSKKYYVVQKKQKTLLNVDWINLAWYPQKYMAETAAEKIRKEYPSFDIRVTERH
jgi:hypothetical protein